MRRYILTVLIACLPGLAAAQDATVPAAYVDAAHAHGVPPVMLYALSLTESAVSLSHGRRPWPWTLNIAGRGERYASRAAACAALRTALEDTPVVDVGLGQLNVRWQRTLFGPDGRFADPCDALDPYANLDAAAALLRRCHDRRAGEAGEADTANSWTTAAGCYHRPAGGSPAARYRAAFSDQLATLDVPETTRSVAGDGGPAARVDEASAATAPTPEMPTDTHTARVTWIQPTDPTELTDALD